nr:glycoside hydrolase family 99-like domain-containing protein [uncultured Draconibacterium sp.]
MKKNARVIAFYLPQFHPIPENDRWWGKGFTEWTNVKKSVPLFKGHYQPFIPSELGYYDLRDETTRGAQAELAKIHGIEGFCYWHYWFGNGKRLLERPFNEVLESGKPNFPFCLAWANESWQGFDFGAKGRNVLLNQEYPGEEDIINHFYEVLPAFTDKRYTTVDNKPLFYIYKPSQLPNAEKFIEIWQNLAVKNNLQGIYFVAQSLDDSLITTYTNLGFDAVNTNRFKDVFARPGVVSRLKRKVFLKPIICDYSKAVLRLEGTEDEKSHIFPTIMPNWDHTPRTGKRGNLLKNSTPELFKSHVVRVLKRIQQKDDEHKIIFLKSWNEWAEGNYMEPDQRYGRAYLEALRSVINL